jgi:uncharacterized protein YkwD
VRNRPILTLAVGLAAAAVGLVVPTAGAAVPIGEHLTIVDKADSITTGDTWHVTAEVDDLLGLPVSGASVWTGTLEPSSGCGADLTALTCTQIATDQQTSDGGGQVTLRKSATLNTFVVFYLDDGTGTLDPTTGQSVLVLTHNNYVWSGPKSVTLKQYAVGDTPYAAVPGTPGSGHTIATGTGAAGAPRTQVSTDGGTTWKTVATGVKSGIFPVTGKYVSPVDRVNLMASQAGTYQVRITDKPGTYEAAGTSDVVTITVTKRAAPGWLKRTNTYRASLGLGPVADNPDYDAALAKHVNWMNIHNQLSHAETPGTKGYTKDGDEAAGASVLAYGRPTGELAVDGWIGAPFHASCLLNAYWSVGGFAIKNGWSGEWCHSSMQTFDLARGANSPVRKSLRRNYSYPSSAMKVPQSVMLNANESPDPVAACSRIPKRIWSVPVIFRVARPPASDRSLHNAKARLTTKSGKRISATCLLTPGTYRGPDTGSTDLGRLILGDRVSGRWAVLLVKAGALKAGRSYTATLTDGGFKQRTAFTIARH